MKFLIADDDPVARLALSSLVANLPGAEVLEANDGDAAWSLLQNATEPLVSLLDNHMPGMDGIDLLRKMRQSPRYLAWPVMLISATVGAESIGAALQLGVNGILLKPVNDAGIDRVAEIAAAFDRSIVTPLADNAVRLDIADSLVQAYMFGVIQQLDVLVVALLDLNEETFPLVKKRVDTCRSAVGTIGSSHLETIFDQLITQLDSATAADVIAYTQAIKATRNRMFQLLYAD